MSYIDSSVYNNGAYSRLVAQSSDHLYCISEHSLAIIG